MKESKRQGKKGSKIRKIGQVLECYTFLAPAYVIFTLFIFIPVGRSVYLSLFEYSLLSMRAPFFVGFENYIEMINDKVFWTSLKNTAVYVLGTVPVRLALSLFIAVLLDSGRLYFRNFFRTCYFLPVVTSMVACAIIWRLIFDAGPAGIANRFIGLFGGTTKGWLADSSLAMLSVIIMSVWKDLGYCMMIYLAGLQGISLELYEASSIDGATGWQKFWYVTLPMLKPTTFFIVTTQIISSFQVFTQTYVMTGGGPGYSTTTLINYLYQLGFNEYRMGYASTVAFMLFVGLLVLSAILRRVFQAEELY